MISRVWHGWTRRENADAYEQMLRSTILPGIHRVAGYEGADLLRRDHGDEVEFVTITRFDSMDAVRAFAGADYEVAVIHPEAQDLLTHYDARSAHYETVVTS
jgi:heme-degrading monooxygenase HmoA